MAPEPLESEPVTKLSKALMQSVKEHFGERPVSRTTVLEILNSLAAVSGYVIGGADDKAFTFFLDALKLNVASAIERRDELKEPH